MESEGLLTTVWGPAFWETLHNITYNYPFEPTEKHKKEYYNFFVCVGNVLPCCTCRNNYKKHITSGDTKLTKEILQSRETLTEWVYKMHKKVCEHLGYDYDLTYEMVNNKHKTYIATCDMSLEQKAKAFRNKYDVHAPVLKINILECLIEYAKRRGLSTFEYNIQKYSKMDRESQEWYERNQKCQEILKYMRCNGISSIESDGEYEGLLTVDELKLMEYASTSLSKKSIKKILKKMGCNIKKNYYLTQ